MKIGKFEVIDFLGNGNFGTVFKAHDTLLDVERAIKIIDAKKPQEFIDAINEAQILEKCRHKHIVDIKEINILEAKGAPHPCITMEYLKNGSVQAFLEKNFISVRLAIKIITDCLFGLEHAHAQDILHRDIKPGNILFDNNYDAKLSDFGLAYGLAHQTFNFNGYKTHLPLEVLEGSIQDELSDLYAMGITLYRLINNFETLSLPFINKTDWEKGLKKEKFPSRVYEPYIPEKITRLVNKSIRADRTRRFQNCLEFRQALQKISLAIDWQPLNNDKWIGKLANDNYEIELILKKSGYSIDFKKNNRKINNFCCVQIKTEQQAREEFFKIIRETTLKI